MAVSGTGLVTALALLGSACRLGSWRLAGRWLAPAAAFVWVQPQGLGPALAAAVGVVLWQAGLLAFLRRRRLGALCEAAEEPVQAMFEQASLYGSAEHCALAALPACSAALRPIWQRALAEWLRGSASEESFAKAGHDAGIPLLVRLARALSLSRHNGTPLARHLAVLLEDSTEERRYRRESEGEALPFFIVTFAMASVLLAVGLADAHVGAGPVLPLALVALLSAGGAAYVAALILP